MAQIGCYMTEAEATEIDAYAESIEITRQSVLALAVQQELRKPRLRRGMRVASIPPGSPGRKRVTVHIRNDALKTAFTRHAQDLGFGLDEAAGILFRLELKEQWFLRTFGLSGNQR